MPTNPFNRPADPNMPSRRDEAAYWQSPVGQADAAYRAGAAFYQLELSVGAVNGTSWLGGSRTDIQGGGGRPDILGQVEARGWRLEHVSHVFVETGSTSSDRRVSSGQGTITRGQIMGIYLFRRRD